MNDIARLIAIEESRQLKARYFRLMDTRDFDAMAHVFCKNAMFFSTGPLSTMAIATRSLSKAKPRRTASSLWRITFVASIGRRNCYMPRDIITSAIDLKMPPGESPRLN
jgi:SnoaL-like protein